MFLFWSICNGQPYLKYCLFYDKDLYIVERRAPLLGCHPHLKEEHSSLGSPSFKNFIGFKFSHQRLEVAELCHPCNSVAVSRAVSQDLPS